MKKVAGIGGKFFRNLRGVTITGVLVLIAFPAFSAPFAYVGEVFSASIRVIDTATNTETATIATSSSDKVAVHPSGDFIYVPNNFSLDVYGTSDNSLVAAIPLGERVLDLAVHPSGDYIYSAHAGTDTISVIDTSSNTVTATIEIAHDISRLVVHPSGHTLYVGVAVNGTVTTIDTDTLQRIDTFNVSGPDVRDLALHPSGQYLYATSARNLQIIDTETNSLLNTIALNGVKIAVHPDGNVVYVAGKKDVNSFVVYEIDVTTNTLSSSVALPGVMGVFDLAVHPSGDFVYVPGYIIGDGPEGRVWVIDTVTNQVTDTIPVTANNSGALGLPLFITMGPLLEPVGGAATGISAISVICTNSTSGQSISVGLGGEKTWDCESSGLQVNSGDSIEMVVTGNAD